MTVDDTIRWGGEGVAVHSELTLGEVPELLPAFDRQPVTALIGRAADSGQAPPLASHRYLDAVVRLPDEESQGGLPVALVSKKYALVQHRDLVKLVSDVLACHLGDEVEKLPAVLAISEYGSRIRLEVRLPDRFTLPDPHELAPTLYCWNSVDGSRPLEVYLGWVRLVCDNGLVIGDARVKTRRRHVRSLSLAEVAGEVDRALGAMARDAEVLNAWAQEHVSEEAVVAWVDATMTTAWGGANACRVFNIVQTGMDGQPVNDRTRPPASRRPFVPGARVPGSEPPNATKYRIAQALSWVARWGREMESAEDRLLAIPELLASLATRRGAGSRWQA